LPSTRAIPDRDVFCLANPVGSAADFEQILTTENQPSPNGYGLAGTKNTEAPDHRRIVDFSAASVTSAVNGLKSSRSRDAIASTRRRALYPDEKAFGEGTSATREARMLPGAKTHEPAS